MGLIGALPRTSQTGNNEWADVETNDARLRDEIDGLLDNANIKPAAGISGSKLAAGSVADDRLTAPNNVAYKTILSTPFIAIGGITVSANPYLPTIVGWSTGPSIGNSANPQNALLVPVLDFVPGDYTVAGLTTNFRIKMQAIVGTTSPSTVTFNAGLYPITSSGNSYTPGSVVVGSTTGTTPTPSLATGTISRYSSSDFAASALTTATTYVPAVVIGSITVPSNIAVSFQLQVHHT